MAAQNGALVRIRGSFCQTSCATGRLAMEEPNLQTVPRPRAFSVEATQRATQPPAPDDGCAAPRRDHEANIRRAHTLASVLVFLSYVNHEANVRHVHSPVPALCLAPFLPWRPASQMRELVSLRS